MNHWNAKRAGTFGPIRPVLPGLYRHEEVSSIIRKYGPTVVKGLSAVRAGLREYGFLVLAFALYSSVFALFLVARYDSFQSGYYDLGIFSRALFSASTDPSRIPALVLPTKDSLIGHVDPFMVLLLPVYAAWPDPRVLLITTSISLGASIFPLYFLGRNHLRKQRFAWLFCVVYLLNPLFNNINGFDFQVIAFGPLLILTALCFYEKGNSLGFVSSIVLANSTQEFMALVTAVLAASLLGTALSRSRRGNPTGPPASGRVGHSVLISVILIGALWFSFAYLIQGYFDPSTPLTNYLSVGPASSGNYVEKIVYVLLMLGPLFFLPLLEPLMIAPILPYLGVVFLGSHRAYWSIYYQYGAFTVAVLFYATLLTLRKLSLRLPVVLGLPSLKVLLALLLAGNAFFTAGYSALSPLAPPAPIGWSFVNDHDRLLTSMIAQIPKDSTILTQSQIYPHLADRSEVSLYYANFSLLDRVSETAPAYLLYDTTQSSFFSPPVLFGLPLGNATPPSEELRRMVSTGAYGLLSASDGAYVFERGYQGLFVSPAGEMSSPLNVTGDWFRGGNYSSIPFGVSLRGSMNDSFFYDEGLYVNQNSFSFSYGLQETRNYGTDSWMGLLIGFKDPRNYLLLYAKAPNGPIGLLKVSTGVRDDRVIVSPPFPASSYHYFYILVSGDRLDVYVDSLHAGTVVEDASSFAGYVGFATRQEDGIVQFLQFTKL